MRAKWFLPVCIGVLMLALTGFGVLGMLGYEPIEGTVVYILLGLLVTLCLGGGGVWLTRRMKKRASRVLVGTACALATAAAVLAMFVFFTFLGSFYLPRHYTTLQSPEGEKLVVMRAVSQKYAYERSQRGGESSVGFDDLGYSYQIYPVFSKFFYNSKICAEGELEIGCDSKATLMHEWTDSALHMYIENPEQWDVGELRFR